MGRELPPLFSRRERWTLAGYLALIVIGFIVLALTLPGCGPLPSPAPYPATLPPPTPPIELARMLVPVSAANGNLPTNLHATLIPWDQSAPIAGINTSDGVLFITGSQGGSTLTMIADGMAPYRANVTITNGTMAPVVLRPALPPLPTREQLLRSQVSMYGAVCDIPELGGKVPWWDPAIMALSPAGRELAWACKQARGDTAVILGAGEHDGILYDEPGNPYQIPVHPFDLGAMVTEALQHGFLVKLFLDGDGDQAQVAFDQFPRVLAKLQHGGPNGEDLHRYVEILPGWDGVFYSCVNPDGGDFPCWTNTSIMAWAKLARASCPDCVLALEFNTGHIPLGEGVGDYTPTGRMRDFDSVLVEFDFNLHTDATWQILARLLGPAYNKPADDPNGSAPCYTCTPSDRGPWGVECFEPPTYLWVRVGVPVPPEAEAAALGNRAYLQSVGCPVVD